MKKLSLLLVPALISCGDSKSSRHDTPAPIPTAITCGAGQTLSEDKQTCVPVQPGLPAVKPTPTPPAPPTPGPGASATEAFEKLCLARNEQPEGVQNTIEFLMKDAFTEDCSFAAYSWSKRDRLVLRHPASDLSPLATLPHLQTLEIQTEASNYATLGQLTSLRSVTLKDSSVKEQELAVLSQLPQLEYLHLSKISNIDKLKDDLAGFTKLKTLQLPEATGSFAFLKAFTELRELQVGTLNGAFKAEDLSQLARLESFRGSCESENQCLSALPHPEKLKILSVTVNNNPSASAVSRFTQLEDLDYRNLDLDADLSGLKDLTRLKHLRVMTEKTTLKTLSGLENMKDLNSLEILAAGLQNLNGLGDKPVLQRFYVARSADLKDISELERRQYPALTNLLLGSKSLRAVEPLKALTSLEELFVGLDAIDDFSFVTQFPKLKSLSFSGVKFADTGILRDMQTLKNLAFFKTQVSDLRPLAELTNLTTIIMPKEFSILLAENCPKDAKSPGVAEYCRKTYP